MTENSITDHTPAEAVPDGAVVPRRRLDVRALAPTAYAALKPLNDAVSAGIDPGLHELVKLRASQINGCAYCVDLHSRDALRAGESERRLQALTVWEETPFFTARERAALALTEAVTLVADTHVPDAVWEDAARHFAPDELAHLVLAIATINLLNRIGVSSRMTPPFRSEG